MKRIVCASIILQTAILILAAVTGRAQKDDASARLEQAANASSMTNIEDKPWHMKLEMTVFDNNGKNPISGTVDVFKSGKLLREVFTFGDSSAIHLYDGKDTYLSSKGASLPYRVSETLEQVLHPGPTKDDLGLGTAVLVPRKVGKVPLDCIMVSPPIKGLDKVPLGLYPTFCLDPASGLIRTSYNFGSQTVVINGFGGFAGHHVVMRLDMSEGTDLVATAQVKELSTYTPEPQEFVPTSDMKRTAMAARVAGGVIAGHKIGGPPPVYPNSAKAYGLDGTVVLHAIIGKDGRVHALRPVSSPDSSLTVAALAAVRQWTYTPYLLNGDPTEVDTTITINFKVY